ncbi:hypothetical protein Gogos_006427 [Gossypium gossypioides]|uniref:Uncharacterized protein n=1 Tax=Gossypium gossypioides TaxID=34282 RepID=A0A7J9C5K8_GOSGO|nr:hypothetical protein [Gossypium gossypioides]
MCPKKATETSQSEVEVLMVAKENSIGDLAFVLGYEGMAPDLRLYLSALIMAISGGGSVLTVAHLAFYNPNLGIEERQAKEMGNQPISPSIFIFTESGKAHHNISYVNFNVPVVNKNIKEFCVDNKLNTIEMISNSTTFLNLIFLGPSGMDVPLKEGVLDPSKHLAISFKEKLTAVEGKTLKANNLIKLGKGIHVGRGRKNGGKNDSNRNGKFLNMTLRGHGERFKASGNLRFPLSDTMNSMAKLISSQIDIVGDTRAQSRNEKGLESSSSKLLDFLVVFGLVERIWFKLRLLFPWGVPWLAIRDFNVILLTNEKRGGQIRGRRFLLCDDFLKSTDVHDLRFKGPQFTWYRWGIFERLDRAIGNCNTPNPV